MVVELTAARMAVGAMGKVVAGKVEEGAAAVRMVAWAMAEVAKVRARMAWAEVGKQVVAWVVVEMATVAEGSRLFAHSARHRPHS